MHWPGLKGQLNRWLGSPGLGVYSFLGCVVAMALTGLVGLGLQEPMLFPSLGPTVLLFFEQPLHPSACPRNTFFGHGIALAAGWISLYVFGLLGAPSVLVSGITPRHIAASALSVGLTAFTKHLVRAPHPPAGATTLIVSLGFLTTPAQLGVMAAAVILVTLAGWCINRLLGVPMPLWQTPSE